MAERVKELPDRDRIVRLHEVIEIRDTLTWQEIEDVLADGGYSADTRKNVLTELLTKLSQMDSSAHSTAERDLIDKIKTVLDEYQSGRPAVKDVM